MKSKMILSLAVAALGLTLVATSSHALTIGICNPDAPGACNYTVTLAGNTLTLNLTNTSPVANGGFITAVAFDLAGAASITAVTTTDSDFSLNPAPPSTGGSISVSPDGTREFVMSATSGVYLGGGSPTGGIGTGGSATFTFTLGGTFGSVSEGNVFDSSLVRFRGFVDGDSDKDNTTQVPEPASLMLLGAGLAAIGLWQWKRRKVGQA